MCPPSPELSTMLDTQEKCNCFYSFVGANMTDMLTIYDENSKFVISQAGEFFGAEGIAEYASYVNGGKFISEYFSLLPNPLMDFTGSTAEECVTTIIDSSRFIVNPLVVKDEQNICLDSILANTFHYTLTGNPSASITIQKHYAWIPTAFTSALFVYLDTPATTEYICDILVNTCQLNRF